MRDPGEWRGKGRVTRRQFVRTALAVAGAAATPAAVITPGAAARSRAPSGTLTVSLPARIVGLDPLGSQAAEEPVRIVAAHIFDTLVLHDPATRRYLPALAVKWETPRPTSWVFTLRQDARFHDGRAVTSADVKASLERMIASRGPWLPCGRPWRPSRLPLPRRS